MATKAIKVKVYNLEGKEVEELTLDSTIFGVDINPALVHQVVEAQRANSRQNLAHTKGRSEVRGGGKKPWKQKGTGRARHGSSRSPIWSGGGVTFGPTKERNFSKKINSQMKKKALYMSLTDKVSENEFIVLDDMKFDKIKTKELNNIFKKSPVKDAKSILLVLKAKDDNITKSARNIENVKTILADSMNVYDILKYENILIDKEAVKKLTKTYKK
jgi:large subunit ribosomal protein L4